MSYTHKILSVLLNQYELFTEMHHNHILYTVHCQLILSYRQIQNKRLKSFQNIFLSILNAFSLLTKHAILHDVCNVMQQLYTNKNSLITLGREALRKTISVFYILYVK